MPSRRDVLRMAGGIALIPLVNLKVQAADKVPLDDPAAVALKYVEDATQATRMDKMGVAGADQLCSNCRFYTESAEAGWGGCTLFQNRLVAGPGWCAGWVPAG
ncbi:MAG: high-potential iron-sulfur protein [Pseudomonadales bacterium]|jgi:hypothetical protein|nr:high-potential iron-sulfur protein [Pseudomonadales bacterium]